MKKFTKWVGTGMLLAAGAGLVLSGCDNGSTSGGSTPPPSSGGGSGGGGSTTPPNNNNNNNNNPVQNNCSICRNKDLLMRSVNDAEKKIRANHNNLEGSILVNRINESIDRSINTILTSQSHTNANLCDDHRNELIQEYNNLRARLIDEAQRNGKISATVAILKYADGEEQEILV